MSTARRNQRAPPPGFEWPGNPNLIRRRTSSPARPRSAGSGLDSLRRRGRPLARSPSTPPQRSPGEQINSPRADNNGAVEMSTQTAVNIETQTTPGLLRRGGDEAATSSGHRVSILENTVAGRSSGDEAAASLNGHSFDRHWPGADWQ